jgi:hypothetical protein
LKGVHLQFLNRQRQLLHRISRFDGWSCSHPF